MFLNFFSYIDKNKREVETMSINKRNKKLLAIMQVTSFTEKSIIDAISINFSGKQVEIEEKKISEIVGHSDEETDFSDISVSYFYVYEIETIEAAQASDDTKKSGFWFENYK